jgi:hypothetical protein
VLGVIQESLLSFILARNGAPNNIRTSRNYVTSFEMLLPLGWLAEGEIPYRLVSTSTT